MPSREQVADLRAASAVMKARHHPGVQRKGWGYKYVNGKRTDDLCVSIGVEKKLTARELESSGVQAIQKNIDGIPTDVVTVGSYTAPRKVDTQEYDQRRRPAPGGISVGHVNITAGTLGAWLKRGTDESSYVILSNNHVLADSNGAQLGDNILQPGPYDTGKNPADLVAKLEDYVVINFGGNTGKNPTKETVARAWFGLWMAIANAPARWRHCPNRLVRNDITHGRRQAGSPTPQPSPNLVDAAVARQFGSNVVDPEIIQLGRPLGFRDLQLGDRVFKSGRTTETTEGMVVVVESQVVVGYGAGKQALFEDQFVIRSDSGEFSAGGDSGSAILDENGFIGSLLFAGGSGETIGNRISHVVSFLGVRI